MFRVLGIYNFDSNLESQFRSLMLHIFPACRKQGMFCFWCVWGRPNIKDQQANVSNVSAADAAELDQLTANQSVNLSTCQPKATPPVNYKVGYFNILP